MYILLLTADSVDEIGCLFFGYSASVKVFVFVEEVFDDLDSSWRERFVIHNEFCLLEVPVG